VTKCGNIISAAEHRAEAINSAENAARSILIRLEVPSEATEAFLAVSEKPVPFPPDAFTVDSGLLKFLSLLSAENPAAVKGREPALLPFPEFTESGLKDYVGRGVKESLDAVRTLTGLKLPFFDGNAGTPVLARPFWQALIRGGYQGAVYYIDSWQSND
jgi:hypothetical protein